MSDEIHPFIVLALTFSSLPPWPRTTPTGRSTSSSSSLRELPPTSSPQAGGRRLQNSGAALVCVNKTGGGGVGSPRSPGQARWVHHRLREHAGLAIIPHAESSLRPLKDIANICVIQPYSTGSTSRPTPLEFAERPDRLCPEQPGKGGVRFSGVGTTNHIIMVRIGQENKELEARSLPRRRRDHPGYAGEATSTQPRAVRLPSSPR
jgi:hypothetical protein